MKDRRHQVKTSWYYLFWGLMSAAVIAGQIYVGSGYHSMSNSIQELIDTR